MANKNNRTSGLYLPLYLDLEAWEAQLAAMKEETAKTLNEITQADRALSFQYKVDIEGAKAANDSIKAATLNMDMLREKTELYSRAIEVVNKALDEERAELAKTGQTESERSRALENSLTRYTQELNKTTILLNKASQMSYKLGNNIAGYDSKVIDKVSKAYDAQAVLNGDNVARASIEFGRLTNQIDLYTDALKRVSGAYTEEIAKNGQFMETAHLLQSTMIDLTTKVKEYETALADAANMQKKFNQTAVSKVDKEFDLRASRIALTGDKYALAANEAERLSAKIAVLKTALSGYQKSLQDEVKANGEATLAAQNWNGVITDTEIQINKLTKELNDLSGTYDSTMGKALESAKRLYDLESSRATLSGDDLAVRQAKIKELTAVSRAYRTEMANVKKALDAEVKANGDASAKAQELKNRLMELETNANKAEAEIKRLNVSFTDFANTALNSVFIRLGHFSVSLQQLSNWFPVVSKGLGNIRDKMAAYESKAKSFVESHSADLAKWASAYGPIALGIAGTTVAVVGLYKAADEAMEKFRALGREGIEAAKSLIQFKSRFELDDGTAGRWADIAAIAGTEINTLAFAIGEVTIAIDKETAAGKRAERAMETYGAAVRDANGNIKNFDAFMKSVAEGYARAAKAGEGTRYLKDIFGRQWVQVQQLLPAMEKYNSILEKTGGFADGNLDAIKATEMSIIASNTALDANKRLWAEIVGESEQYFQQLDIERYKVINDFLNNNKQVIKDALSMASSLLGLVTRAGTLTIETAEGLGLILNEVFKRLGDVKRAAKMDPDSSEIAQEYAESLAESVKANKENTNELEKQVTQKEALLKMQNKLLEAEKAQNRINDLYKPLDKIIRQGGMDEYSKELDNLVEKYEDTLRKIRHEMLSHPEMKFDVDYETVMTAYATELSALQEKYIYKPEREANKKMLEEQSKLAKEEAKKYEEAVKAAQKAQEEVSMVFMSETEKRIYQINKEKDAWIQAGADEVAATQAAQAKIREAKMSEAERTLREQAALIKKARKLQEAGATDEEIASRLQAFSTKKYMSGLGLKERDLLFAQTKGLDFFKGFTENARNSILSRFTGNEQGTNVNNNNTVNVTFDNTVVENEATMVSLANKVAGLIIPVVEKAVNVNNTANSY